MAKSTPPPELYDYETESEFDYGKDQPGHTHTHTLHCEQQVMFFNYYSALLDAAGLAMAVAAPKVLPSYRVCGRPLGPRVGWLNSRRLVYPAVVVGLVDAMVEN